MILDSLEHHTRYTALSPLFAKAFAYLLSVTDATPVGTHEIEGEAILAHVQQHPTSLLEGRLYEAHQQYIDIQYIQRGREVIYWNPVAELTNVVMPFDAAKDAALYGLAPTGQAVPIRAGQFAIFFPEDGHIPSIAWGTIAPVRKVVVKVRIA